MLSVWLSIFSLVFHSALYRLSGVFLAKWMCRYLLGAGAVQFTQEEQRHSERNGMNVVLVNGKTTDVKHKPRVVSEGDLAEVAQLIVGLLFAPLASVFGLIVMYQSKEDVINQQSWVLVPFAHFGAWYYLLDLYTMFTSYRLRKRLYGLSTTQTIARFIRGRWSMVGHHLLLLCIAYPLTVSIGARGGKGDFVLGAFIAQDLSTPLLSLIKILRLLGLDHSILYRLTGLALLPTFFLARVANIPFIMLLYTAQHHNWNLSSALSTMTPLCHFFNSVLFVLQSYWFLSLLRIAVSSHCKRKPHQKL